MRRILTMGCGVMGVLLLVIAWHLRDPEAPQSLIMAGRINNQITLFQAGLGDPNYWRQLTPALAATEFLPAGTTSDSFYFWTFDRKLDQFGGFGPSEVDFTLYQMGSNGLKLQKIDSLTGPLIQPFPLTLPLGLWSLQPAPDGTIQLVGEEGQRPLQLPPNIAQSHLYAYGTSADDDRLYLVSGSPARADLYAYQFEDGQVKNLTAGLAQGFASLDAGKILLLDDNKLAFYTDGTFLNITTGQTIPITLDFQPAQPLTNWVWQWLPHTRLLIGHSPDGRVIAIQPDDGAVRWSLENVQGLAIGPNTEWVVYQALDGFFHLIQPGSMPPTTFGPIVDFYSIVSWTDRYIIYKTHTPQPDEEKLWRMNPDGSNRVLLADGLLDVEFVAWSPDQTWLLYQSMSPTGSVPHLEAVHVEDGVVQRVGPISQDRLDFLAWGPLLPKRYTYVIVSAVLGLLFLLIPLVALWLERHRTT